MTARCVMFSFPVIWQYEFGVAEKKRKKTCVNVNNIDVPIILNYMNSVRVLPIRVCTY